MSAEEARIMPVPGLYRPHDRYDACSSRTRRRRGAVLPRPPPLGARPGDRAAWSSPSSNPGHMSEGRAALRDRGLRLPRPGPSPPPSAAASGDTPFGQVVSAGRPKDDDWLAQATRLLSDIGPRIRPATSTRPSGVGGHIDHRLAHEAALRTSPARPASTCPLRRAAEAFIPGRCASVWGSRRRLPPGAAEAPERPD